MLFRSVEALEPVTQRQEPWIGTAYSLHVAEHDDPVGTVGETEGDRRNITAPAAEGGDAAILGGALEARHDRDFRGGQCRRYRGRVEVAEPGPPEVVVGGKAGLPAREGTPGDPSFPQRDGEKTRGLQLAGGQQAVEFLARRITVELPGQGEELVGDPGHRRDDDQGPQARLQHVDDAIRGGFDPIDPGQRCPPALPPPPPPTGKKTRKSEVNKKIISTVLLWANNFNPEKHVSEKALFNTSSQISYSPKKRDFKLTIIEQ